MAPLIVGTNHEYVQAYNQRLILDMIRLHSPLSRADIARGTSLAVPTVSRIVGELVRKGLVVETQQRRGNLGKPPLDLAVNPEGAYAIGFNYDRDQLVGVLVDLMGRVLERVQHDVTTAGPEATMALMGEMTRGFLAQNTVRARVLGVGVGIPGPLHLDPVPPSKLFALPGWEGVAVLKTLTRQLGLPVFLENNPFAAAIGEMWYGEGRTLSNFYFIFFGLYLGGCAVIGRQPNRGAGGFAAEFGSIPFEQDARFPDGVRRLGHCVSLAALYETLRRHGHTAKGADSLSALYHAHDPHLLAWLEDAVDILAPELWRLECLFDPEAIVFGERLPPPLVNHLIGRLETRLAALRISYKPYGPKLVRGWAGPDAAALGAATLPIYHALAPNHLLLMQAQAKQDPVVGRESHTLDTLEGVGP